MFESLDILSFSFLEFADAPEMSSGNGPDELDPFASSAELRSLWEFDEKIEKKLQTVADPDGALHALHNRFHDTLLEYQSCSSGSYRDVLKARLAGLEANLRQRLGL